MFREPQAKRLLIIWTSPTPFRAGMIPSLPVAFLLPFNVSEVIFPNLVEPGISEVVDALDHSWADDVTCCLVVVSLLAF